MQHDPPKCHLAARDACNLAADMLLCLADASPQQVALALPTILKWQDATVSLRNELRTTTPTTQEMPPYSFKKEQSEPLLPRRSRSRDRQDRWTSRSRSSSRGRQARSYSRSRGRQQRRDRSRSFSRYHMSRSRSREQPKSWRRASGSGGSSRSKSRSRDQGYHTGRDSRQSGSSSKTAERSRSLERLLKQMKGETWVR